MTCWRNIVVAGGGARYWGGAHGKDAGSLVCCRRLRGDDGRAGGRGGGDPDRAGAGASPAITNYPNPNVISFACGITTGADGALWFTNSRGNSIGRMTTDGHMTTYTAVGVSHPSAITGRRTARCGSPTPVDRPHHHRRHH